MTSTAVLWFLQLIVLVVIPPTEYSTVSTEISAECKRVNSGCREFETPKHDVGRYKCLFRNKSCAYICTLWCPQGNNEFSMAVSDRRYASDSYVCSNNQWTRRELPQAYCVVRAPVTSVMQNFSHVSDVNNLISVLFNTSYIYLAMASFYERADVALPGFSKLMNEMWQNEVKYARDFISYINMRGGSLTFTDIPRPSNHEILLMNMASRPGLLGLETALRVSREVNDICLRIIHPDIIKKKRFDDPHLKFYLEDGIISHKINTIKKLADLVKQLRSFADEDYDIGEYMLNLEIDEAAEKVVA